MPHVHIPQAFAPPLLPRPPGWAAHPPSKRVPQSSASPLSLCPLPPHPPIPLPRPLPTPVLSPPHPRVAASRVLRTTLSLGHPLTSVPHPHVLRTSIRSFPCPHVSPSSVNPLTSVPSPPHLQVPRPPAARAGAPRWMRARCVETSGGHTLTRRPRLPRRGLAPRGLAGPRLARAARQPGPFHGG